MKPQAETQALIRELEYAQKLLGDVANTYRSLQPASRLLRRLRQRVSRPLRLAILGESNSGKSSIANLLAGEVALPALPVANTRLPTLLHHAINPTVRALHRSGKYFALSANRNVAYNEIVRLEVGLPSERLRTIEILDLPGAANPLFLNDFVDVHGHRINAAIWATVATQAWRESERVAWLGLPPRIRRFGLLAVTHCDLIVNEADMTKLRARLTAVAKDYFSDICYVAPSGAEGANGAFADLFSKVERLNERFESERRNKALLITQRVAANTLERLEQTPMIQH